MNRTGAITILLVAFLAACSSTGGESEDFSTGDYDADPQAVSDSIRTFLHSSWFKTSYVDDNKNHMWASLRVRQPTESCELDIRIEPNTPAEGRTQVVVTGKSAGGMGTVRQWQMRVHRHMRMVYGASG